MHVLTTRSRSNCLLACLWGAINYPKSRAHPWTFACLSLYNLPFKRVLYLSACQRAAKVQTINFFLDYSFLLIGVSPLIWICSFTVLWSTETYNTSLERSNIYWKTCKRSMVCWRGIYPLWHLKIPLVCFMNGKVGDFVSFSLWGSKLI